VINAQQQEQRFNCRSTLSTEPVSASWVSPWVNHLSGSEIK